MDELPKLTQYSRGAGCGCKISPQILDELLKSTITFSADNKLLVGNSTKDDAAVYDIGNGMAIISTTDFFMPVADDPFDFGRIAAANSISDVYAMGGKPLMAIAVLGWPVEKLSPSIAAKVLDGGRTICKEAGIMLAGGHSIDSAEPIFGLAVTGIVSIANLKRNNSAKAGDHLLLTKPLGVGILSTAQKRELLNPEHLRPMISQMTALNKIGEELGNIKGVNAMTDITGFGLLGHLIEMCDGSGTGADLFYNQLHLSPGVKEYIAKRIFPDATTRNWSNYSKQVSFEKGVNVMEAFSLLPDPQTNGGLLISVTDEALPEVIALFKKETLDQFISPVGRMTEEREKTVKVVLSLD